MALHSAAVLAAEENKAAEETPSEGKEVKSEGKTDESNATAKK
jgi:hypothetical protein